MLNRYHQKNLHEAGCDEAGRGCLAGPVYAAAVILNPANNIPGLNDSKKLSRKKRDELRLEIENCSIAWAVASCTVEEIDSINILQASVKAMHKAIRMLKMQPEFLLIDGNYFKPVSNIPYQTIVGGDGLYPSIAAASILAKTHRDEYMEHLHEEFPHFGFNQHKGYATAQHIEAINKFGYADVHRRSFTLKKLQLKLL